ncbi:MAG: lipid-A-disaccharide synthase [Gammaproteobacteria bacterium]|nr:MAG: lipid-A-disaccharide synthase [Gammaproteobacteria bacterium]
MSISPTKRIGVIAGEVSGDYLGAELLKELNQQNPGIEYIGICGELMKQQGCVSLYPMRTLSIIGYLEAFIKYIKIVRIRKRLIEFFLANPPDLFIGIDVPDFNLKLEKKLKRAGIPTVHYVSPTVWAWRSYRIHEIKKSVSHMLTLFPFEAEYYKRYKIPVTFVGHPLADHFAVLKTQKESKVSLGIAQEKKVFAILPGSRRNELRHHSVLLARTMKILHKNHPGCVFLVPLIGKKNRQIFKKALAKISVDTASTKLLDGNAHEAMSAADMVILASGTATLEAALLKKVMVVFYRLSWLSYTIIRFLSHVKLYSLPNNLAGYDLVPELIQKNATPEKIVERVESLLDNEHYKQKASHEYDMIRKELQKNASQGAARAVLQILNNKEDTKKNEQ